MLLKLTNDPSRSHDTRPAGVQTVAAQRSEMSIRICAVDPIPKERCDAGNDALEDTISSSGNAVLEKHIQ